MKTRFFLLATMATLALVGCKKEANPPAEPAQGAPAVIEIKLTGSDATKAVGAPVVATETAIKKGVILMFRAGVDPALDARVNFDFTGSAVQPVRVVGTQGIRQIYVVANANPADFTQVFNLSDLMNITNKLSLAAFRADGALPMSGFVNNVDLMGFGQSNVKPITIQLDFIGARVHVDWDVTNIGVTGMVISGAMILNTHAKSEYLASPNGIGGYNPLTHAKLDFLHGAGDVSSFTGSHLPSVGLAGTTNNFDTELFIDLANKGFDNNYTYVFENGSTKPIIVTIKGTYNAQVYYWPIVINGALNGAGGSNMGDGTAIVKRGMIYKVKAIIKGLGHDDPYAPIAPGVVDVTIVPAVWSPEILIDQEFL